MCNLLWNNQKFKKKTNCDKYWSISILSCLSVRNEISNATVRPVILFGILFKRPLIARFSIFFFLIFSSNYWAIHILIPTTGINIKRRKKQNTMLCILNECNGARLYAIFFLEHWDTIHISVVYTFAWIFCVRLHRNIVTFCIENENILCSSSSGSEV